MNNNKINRKLLMLLFPLLLTGCSGSDSSEDAGDEVITEIDTDNDGIIDSIDTCPNTSPDDLALVDDTGCLPTEFDYLVLAVNSGGLAYTSAAGIEYQADAYFDTGDTSSTGSSIQQTDDDLLYQTERWGNFTYTFDLPNGNYNVRIHLAEIFHDEANKRAMDISIEGESIVSALDIYNEVGKNSAHILEADDISVTDGQLNLEFIPNIDNAKVSAIDISLLLLRSGDEDNDGVENITDKCVYTSADLISQVDESGCAPAEIDADNDGLMDNLDLCLNTELTALVDNDGCSASQRDQDNDLVMDHIDQCNNTPTESTSSVNSIGCNDTISAILAQPFLEQDGLLVIDLASLDLHVNWEVNTAKQSISDRFIEWNGSDYFNDPGYGATSAKFYIQNPGVYRFDWRNLINHGADPTEHNDSWLKILADNFYGHKADNHIVCPREQDSGNQCVGSGPQGSSSKGWFKVYRSGGPTDEWKWAAYTSDNDSHAIYAVFDNVGEYELQISGRSRNHAIDRLVLYRYGNETDNVNAGFATSTEREESIRYDQ